MALILGIDTGGTYTDGVLLDQETNTILFQAKAPTTHHNLAVGIRDCLHQLANISQHRLNGIVLSTTLATNMVVEGKGYEVGLLLLGKAPNGRIPTSHYRLLPGLLDIKGKLVGNLPTPAEILDAGKQLQNEVSAIAVSGYASVKNPEIELLVKNTLQQQIDLPIVCAHELTQKLGFQERTVTAVLNARLLPVIDQLLQAVHQIMAELALDVPVYIVKGDGSLLSEEIARQHPIHTILSGPAASIIGGYYLTAASDAMIVDMGGTTTDIAFIEQGQVKLSPDGACVGGWQTMTDAAEVYTYGIGGDSLFSLDPQGNLQVGPSRVLPLCRADEQIPGKMEQIGLTPTDILHGIGRYCRWDTAKSEGGILAMAKTMGLQRQDFLTLAEEKVTATLLTACQEALAQHQRRTGRVFSPNKLKLIALGAPACAWLPVVAQRLGIEALLPRYGEVASALGAATGEVLNTITIIIRPGKGFPGYVVYTPWNRKVYQDLETAKTSSLQEARAHATAFSQCCGVTDYDIHVEEKEIHSDSLQSQNSKWLETQLRVVLIGKPNWSR